MRYRIEDQSNRGRVEGGVRSKRDEKDELVVEKWRRGGKGRRER